MIVTTEKTGLAMLILNEAERASLQQVLESYKNDLQYRTRVCPPTTLCSSLLRELRIK